MKRRRRTETTMYEYVLLQLELWKGRWPDVAEGSGVPLRTLEKIARKESPDPRYFSVERLYRWFIANPLPGVAVPQAIAHG